jgi:uncharacterized protein YfaT (DUF1175 family)
MKRLLSLLSLPLLLGLRTPRSRVSGNTCPAHQLKDETTLVQVEHAWLGASARGDTVALGCILANEFEEADFDGSLIERSAMIANGAKPGDGHYELADVHARIYGDVAYVRGKAVKNDNGVRTAKGRFTDIFVYRDGRWQCVAGHESHFPEQHGAR